MTQWNRWLVVGLLAIGIMPGAAWAMSDVDILLNKLVEKGTLTSSEAQEIRNEIGGQAKAREEEQKTFVKDTSKDFVPKWLEGMNFSGDIRLRHETQYRQTSAKPDRNRERFRLRLKTTKDIIKDTLIAGFRLATGTTMTDPVSTNQSFGDTFGKKPINIDEAYLEYKPVEGVELWGGKFENLFLRNFKESALVWDPDVTTEGAAFLLQPKFTGPVQPWVAAGGYALSEVSLDGEDPSLWGTQGGVTLKPFYTMENPILNKSFLKGMIAYYDYVNVQKEPIGNFNRANTGNTTTASAYTFDYNLLNFGAELGTELPTLHYWLPLAGNVDQALPVVAFGDYVRNTAVVANSDGFLFGVKVGKADRPGTLEAKYFYERLKADAVFDALTDSDFGQGGTNHQGHVFQLTLGTLKNSTFGVKYFLTDEITGAKNHRNTLQVDWITKF